MPEFGLTIFLYHGDQEARADREYINNLYRYGVPSDPAAANCVQSRLMSGHRSQKISYSDTTTSCVETKGVNQNYIISLFTQYKILSLLSTKKGSHDRYISI